MSLNELSYENMVTTNAFIASKYIENILYEKYLCERYFKNYFKKCDIKKVQPSHLKMFV